MRGAGWWCVSSHRGSGRAQLRIFLIIRTLHACVLSLFGHVQLCVTLWTIAHQAPLSVGFSRQEYCSELPCPPSRNLSNPVIEPESTTLQADSLPTESSGNPSSFASVQFSISVLSDSLRPHELQHTKPPCPSPSPGVHSNSRPSSR